MWILGTYWLFARGGAEEHRGVAEQLAQPVVRELRRDVAAQRAGQEPPEPRAASQLYSAVRAPPM